MRQSTKGNKWVRACVYAESSFARNSPARTRSHMTHAPTRHCNPGPLQAQRTIRGLDSQSRVVPSLLNVPTTASALASTATPETPETPESRRAEIEGQITTLESKVCLQYPCAHYRPKNLFIGVLSQHMPRVPPRTHTHTHTHTCCAQVEMLVTQTMYLEAGKTQTKVHAHR